MNIDDLGNVLSEFSPICLVVNSSGFIVWASHEAKKELKIKPQQMKFDESFGINPNNLEPNQSVYTQINGHQFQVYSRKINTSEGEFHCIFFHLAHSFKNPQVKIHSLEAIIDKISDGIIISDCYGKIVAYNNAMEKLEDRRSIDMVGKFIWDAYGYSDANESEHRKVFTTGKPIINNYSAHAYNDGIPKFVLYSTYPITINGETLGVFTVSKNETRLHKLLSETIELKRQVTSQHANNKKQTYYSNGTSFTFSDIVGTSDAMKRLIQEAQSLAWLDNNLLIVGDTGTGKEVFAQSIHNHGKRSDEPFIGINCSAIPENLLESILFGTVKGAYTGAVDSKGLFVEAKNGTLFLDELNSMPHNMQTKLLRVLQEKRVRPVGGNATYPVDCRIISAMNEDPHQLIKNGQLREDFYYRIAGYNLFISPLRERLEDLFDIADTSIHNYNQSMERNIRGLSKELKNLMKNYHWPGNVRELQHFIENLMVRANENDKVLSTSHIPDYLKERILSQISIEMISTKKESLPDSLRSLERKIILESLNDNAWNVSKTASKLGIIRQSLLYRMKKLRIEKNNV
ncbi:MAG: sigma 54-interacting transcriptional regulator [Bacillota bacterium]|nr:sigma 54-interacting transcriptional regulator [Bacillota bacterium]